MKRVLILALGLLLSGCTATGGGLLILEGGHIVTAVEPALDVEAPEGFRAAGPVDLTPTGGATDASLAAWLGGDAFVMIYAARGEAEDHGALPVFELPCGRFRTRSFCSSYSEADLVGRGALAFLANNGFVGMPALRLRELIRTGDAGDTEVILSYGERLSACPSKPSLDARAAFDARLRERLRVVELGVSCSDPGF